MTNRQTRGSRPLVSSSNKHRNPSKSGRIGEETVQRQRSDSGHPPIHNEYIYDSDELAAEEYRNKMKKVRSGSGNVGDAIDYWEAMRNSVLSLDGYEDDESDDEYGSDDEDEGEYSDDDEEDVSSISTPPQPLYERQDSSDYDHDYKHRHERNHNRSQPRNDKKKENKKRKKKPSKAVKAILGMMGKRREYSQIKEWAELEEPLSAYIKDLKARQKNEEDERKKKKKRKSPAVNAIVGLMGEEAEGITEWEDLEEPFTKYIKKIVKPSEQEQCDKYKSHDGKSKSQQRTRTERQPQNPSHLEQQGTKFRHRKSQPSPPTKSTAVGEGKNKRGNPDKHKQKHDSYKQNVKRDRKPSGRRTNTDATPSVSFSFGTTGGREHPSPTPNTWEPSGTCNSPSPYYIRQEGRKKINNANYPSPTPHTQQRKKHQPESKISRMNDMELDDAPPPPPPVEYGVKRTQRVKKPKKDDKFMAQKNRAELRKPSKMQQQRKEIASREIKRDDRVIAKQNELQQRYEQGSPKFQRGMKPKMNIYYDSILASSLQSSSPSSPPQYHSNGPHINIEYDMEENEAEIEIQPRQTERDMFRTSDFEPALTEEPLNFKKAPAVKERSTTPHVLIEYDLPGTKIDKGVQTSDESDVISQTPSEKSDRVDAINRSPPEMGRPIRAIDVEDDKYFVPQKLLQDLNNVPEGDARDDPSGIKAPENYSISGGDVDPRGKKVNGNKKTKSKQKKGLDANDMIPMDDHRKARSLPKENIPKGHDREMRSVPTNIILKDDTSKKEPRPKKDPVEGGPSKKKKVPNEEASINDELLAALKQLSDVSAYLKDKILKELKKKEKKKKKKAKTGGDDGIQFSKPPLPKHKIDGDDEEGILKALDYLYQRAPAVSSLSSYGTPESMVELEKKLRSNKEVMDLFGLKPIKEKQTANRLEIIGIPDAFGLSPQQEASPRSGSGSGSGILTPTSSGDSVMTLETLLKADEAINKLVGMARNAQEAKKIQQTKDMRKEKKADVDNALDYLSQKKSTASPPSAPPTPKSMKDLMDSFDNDAYRANKEVRATLEKLNNMFGLR